MKKKTKTKEEQRSCDRCKGDGRGGECSQRSYDRWALGEGGEGQGQGRRGRGEEEREAGRGGGGGGGGERERGEEEREGARQARHFWPVEPTTLGPSSPSLCAN